MLKAKILLWKTIEDNWGEGLGLGLGFFYFILSSQLTDPLSNMLQTLLGRKKYEEAMSDEHPRNGDRKIMHSIWITSRPSTRIKKWNHLS